MTLPPGERYLNWVHDPAPPPTRYHGDLTSPAPSENQENTQPKMPLASFQGGYGLVGVSKSSLGLTPMKAQHPPWLGQRPSLGHQPIGIRLSRKPMRRPGRGQQPIEIRRLLEIGLEPAGQARVPQWNILGPSCTHSIHSIPDSGTNQNSECQFDPDNPEFRGVYKPGPAKHPAGLHQTISSRLLLRIWPLLTCSSAISSRTPSLDRPLGHPL